MNNTPNTTFLPLKPRPKRKNKISKEKRKLLNQKYRTHLKNHVEHLKQQYNNLYTLKYKDYPSYWYNPFLIPKIYSRNHFITIENVFFVHNYNLTTTTNVFDLLKHAEECQLRFVKDNLQLSQYKDDHAQRNNVVKRINNNKVHIVYCQLLITVYRAIIAYYNVKDVIDECVL